MTTKGFLLVLCSCPQADVAAGLARHVLERDLAACVNILPAIRSMYVWRGAIEVGDEVLMLLKTTTDRFASLRETLVANHPYEVPEVVAVEITDGHHAYLDWLADPTARADRPVPGQP